ncbi:isochorismate synthase [Leucobacter viscericola]|uniref:isochorismate synthase n=1 Tax=Leucobacter viscericola TaxID=2714935 RepID=A0A6G7XGC1_9MICO|nr:isochorismate synthase [Leucobacter viscericola]
MRVPINPAVPVLRAVTGPLAGTPDLVSLADPSEPLLWIRGDRGCVGIGEALRLTFTGPNRFAEAANTWRAIAKNAQIDDPVQMPGTGLVALGTFAFADHSEAESVLIVPRFLVAQHREAAWITEINEITNSTQAAEAASQEAPAIPTPKPQNPWHATTFEAATDTVNQYLEGVRKATETIDRGEAEKIVLARQITGTLADDADLRTPLKRLADRYLDCWTFAVDGLIGASPETLIRTTDGAVSARVLAGTRGRHPESDKRDAQARDELLTSAKEQHEHAFAVQSVVTALSPHVNELRTSEAPFPLQLPNVWHLATDLGATLKEQSSSLELVDAIHPSAAIAGTPTATAVAAINTLEPFDRGRYSGAVGWIDADGDGEWVIALRCAQVEKAEGGQRRIIASAGGGIVAGSDPEHELGETVSKFRPITEAFGA